MKRSPLKRKTELSGGEPLRTKTPMRRTPIARAAPLKRSRDALQRLQKPRKALPAVSAARKPEKGVRAALVERLAGAGVVCEVCPELARVYGVTVPGGCSGLGGIHERRKRSSAGTLKHAGNLIPCCNNSNGWIETSTGERSARVMCDGWLVIRSRHPEWELYGRRDAEVTPVEVKLCRRCGAAYVTVPPSGRLACGHAA